MLHVMLAVAACMRVLKVRTDKLRFAQNGPPIVGRFVARALLRLTCAGRYAPVA